MHRIMPIASLILLGPTILSAGTPQAQRADTPAFEVASVRYNTTGGDRGSRRSLPGGRLVISNMTLEQLIEFAYGIDFLGGQSRLIGGPPELLSKRFDITATPRDAVSTTAADHPRMLKMLLVDRFKLQAHAETRKTPVFSLTLANEGSLGPQLRRSSHDCPAWLNTPKEQRGAEPRDINNRPLCIGTFGPPDPDTVTRGTAGPMSTLVRWAQAHLPDRPVLDMTGLTGNFEWKVTFSRNATAPAPDATAPSIFTAFREQLGLKLEPSTAPIEVLVIDSVDMPTPN